MHSGQPASASRYFLKGINWKLLVFLILVLNVKLVVKFAALGLFFLLLPKKLKENFSWKNPQVPLFYPLIIGIAILGYFVYRGFDSQNYTIAFLLGLAIWGACMLASVQVKQLVTSSKIEEVHCTLIVFFLLNALASFFQYAAIIIETGALNAYRYQGDHQKYFINTGDYIKGITFDTSTTNAILSSLGLIYFLFKRSYRMMFLCMATLLLTASNITVGLMIACFVGLMIIGTDRNQKSLIVVCIALVVIFFGKITPHNSDYVATKMESYLGIPKPETGESQKKTDTDAKTSIARNYLDSISKEAVPELTVAAAAVNPAELPVYKKPALPKVDIHSDPYQFKDDTTIARKELIELAQQDSTSYPEDIPGKITAMRQSLHYLLEHPVEIPLGHGMGKFSSKLAFKSSGLSFAGGYPARFVHVDTAFRQNHLDLYSYFFSRHPQFHSVVNSPNSVYDQMTGEYGLTGLAAFGLFYLGFFVKRYRKLSYGLPLLLMMASFFFIDYWFEQLSVVIIFELLVFLNLKEREAIEKQS